MDMRSTLLIALALLALGCERPPPPRSMAAPEALARAAVPGAQTPAAVPPAAPAAPPATPTPRTEPSSDAAITGKIRTALVADPGMAGADISINTDHGVVVLSGTVKSHEQTGIASAHAQRQDGVMRVDNHLRPPLS